MKKKRMTVLYIISFILWMGLLVSYILFKDYDVRILIAILTGAVVIVNLIITIINNRNLKRIGNCPKKG
jgi:uncharacterized membrane protein YjjB (DUF3815 family)